jgi:hypothetical protein
MVVRIPSPFRRRTKKEEYRQLSSPRSALTLDERIEEIMDRVQQAGDNQVERVAGQPGRRASHRHAAADPGHRPQATGSGAAHRLVRACLQPAAAIARARSGYASALAWLERASLPVSWLSDPHIVRAALGGLCTRLDGSPDAAKTITRKRAVFHGALGNAVELGLLPANPISLVRWRVPRAAVAVSPATVPSPAQVRAILAQ